MPLTGEHVRLRPTAHAWERLQRGGGGGECVWGGGFGPPVPSPHELWSAPASDHTLRARSLRPAAPSPRSRLRRATAGRAGACEGAPGSLRRGVGEAQTAKRGEAQRLELPGSAPFWLLMKQKANRTRAPVNAGAPLPPIACSARSGRQRPEFLPKSGRNNDPITPNQVSVTV